ncbi:MAG: transposase, partial [Symploca sp. SIO2G7]|nr:transposase [Symploca sp. SIO2G7]
NESVALQEQIEAYYSYTGVYPESVHVDQVYRTRKNRAFCKERGIRMSGPPLGRPPKNVSLSKKQQALEDERIRNAIEGKFGISKRRFSLNRVMAKLPHTSETAIAITFLVMNLSTLLRQFFGLFLCFQQKHSFWEGQSLLKVITKTIVNNNNLFLLDA